MKCTRCNQLSEFELDFYDYGKAKFVCFNCKACNHYSDSVDLSKIDSEDEFIPYIKDESLYEMLNQLGCDRKKALREIITRRLNTLIVTVRTRNHLYKERLKLKELL